MVNHSILFSLFASAILSSVTAAPSDGPSFVVPGAYIVEFEDGQDEPAFYNTLESNAIPATPRLSLSYTLFKGASFRIENVTNEVETVAQIESTPVVKKLWPIRVFSVPRDEVLWTANDGPENIPAGVSKREANTNDTFSPHVMTQVDKLRAEGVTGKGLKVAVIDTGIDYLHPALGGCFGRGCLVSYGTDLVGDNYDGTNIPVPDQDPIDECEGHGTHVAGTVAAQVNPYGFTGTAPDVTLGAYRVFGCGGNAGNDVLIAAYNQAYEDGSDIITASIGGPSGWSEDPWAVAVQRIVEAGVPCTASAGNSGSSGLFFASTAQNGKGVTAVASVDNVEAPVVLLNASFTTAQNGEEQFGWTQGNPANWGNISLPLYALTLNTSDPANGCTPYPDDTPDLSGFIVLIRRGTCTYVQKATNAAAKGAKYIMFYNNNAGTVSVTTVVPGIQGVGMVTSTQGAEWVGLLAAGAEVTLNIIDPKAAGQFLEALPNTFTGGFLSTFTSWGPTYEIDVKPQIAAPGGIILSTYPRALGSYAVLSGTSMACPQAAGVIALIAQVRGTKDPREIENVLSATANPNLFHDGSRASPFLAPVAQQGSGLIQAYDAAHSTTILSVSSLSFNDTQYFIEKTSFTVRNTGNKEVTFELGAVGAGTGYTLAPGSTFPDTFPNDFATTYAEISFDEDSITVPAGGEVVVNVDVTTPDGLDEARLPVYSGYITLNGTNGENLSLPYLGVQGSMYDATVLDKGIITYSNDPNNTPIPENTVFTIPRYNGTVEAYPVVIASLALGTRLLYADVIPQSSDDEPEPYGEDSSIGQVYGFPQEYIPRPIAGVVWDGRLNDQTYVPAGQYTILIRALKIFGNPDDKDDYYEWESIEFGIKYI